jgi:hypothetical protein
MTRHRIRDDDGDIVADGEVVHVPMYMRDAVIRERDAGRHGILHGGDFCRPGFIVAADASARGAGEAARQQWIVDTCNAWRSDADRQSDDAAPPRGPIADAAEAQRVCREARDRYIRELQDAWRR